MDIFTDASFNSQEQKAGVACIVVVPNVFASYKKVYVYTDTIKASNVHSAELWAIAFALKNIDLKKNKQYRLFTDSNRASGFIKNASYIDMLSYNAQLEIEDVAVKVKEMSSVLQFYTMLAHQKGQGKNPFIFYNKMADKASKKACKTDLNLSEVSCLMHSPKVIKRAYPFSFQNLKEKELAS